MSSGDHPPLFTPIVLKRDAEFVWPCGVSTFYLLTSDGLFLCRDHEFFKSCVKTDRWPGELAPHEPSLQSRFPRLSQRDFERIVGFFHVMAERDDAEAAVLLVWDRREQRVRLVVPPQVATVEEGWSGGRWPVGLAYDACPELPAHQVLLGDVHSHVRAAAYASGIDVHDEMHRPGLHIVVGRLQDEVPDLHVAAVVDGGRFTLPAEAVIEGYERRDLDVPSAWLDQVEVEIQTWQPWWASSGSTSGATDAGGSA